jgi:hypothetical protein
VVAVYVRPSASGMLSIADPFGVTVAAAMAALGAWRALMAGETLTVAERYAAAAA